jgi:ATP/ADP translocase
MKLLQRSLSSIVDVREEEGAVLLLMFLNSFLIMTAHNIVKWLSRAQFIEDLGADNLPYVLLAAGILVGLVMQGYSRAVGYVPAGWIIPAVQLFMAGFLIVFWVLFRTGQDWTSIGLYFFSLILGLLLISQFWTLANDVYDPRQAKRLFGFIGGGASLGGVMGSAILAFTVERVGSENMLLVSAALLVLSSLVVTVVIRRSGTVLLRSAALANEEEGSSSKRGLRLLFESRHLQLIAVVIGFAALGAGLLDQQLNMATEEAKGAGGAAGIAAFLGQIGIYTSMVGFVIQVWLTSRIQTRLGIGFAMLILPVSLGATGGLILATGGLWAAAMARILDTSLRYTVDKTSREILFIPLPAGLKHQAKPFVDVTVDRFSKAMVALLILVLIKPWGLGLGWRQLSVVSLLMTGVWIMAAIKARREYLIAFRTAVYRQAVEPTEVRVAAADLSTVETLVEELAHPEEERVLYAIDVLKSLDKRNLVTPLLLRHESAAVRAHALHAMSSARSEIAARWVPAIQRMIGDESPEVRAAAVGALANIRNENAAEFASTLLEDQDPRIVATAAVVLAGSGREDHIAAAQRGRG